jgi:hypothetical protein
MLFSCFIDCDSVDFGVGSLMSLFFCAFLSAGDAEVPSQAEGQQDLLQIPMLQNRVDRDC